MIYRSYVRWPDQRVADKTVTPWAGVAEQAFRLVLRRGKLGIYGDGAVAVLTMRDETGRAHGLEHVPLGPDVDERMTIHIQPEGGSEKN